MRPKADFGGVERRDEVVKADARGPRKRSFLRAPAPQRPTTRSSCSRHANDNRFKLVVILLTLACSACAENRGQEIAKNVRTIRREQRPDRLLDIGKGFASIGDFTRAEEYFAAAIDQGGDEKAILPLLLRVCVLDGRYRSAIEYAENHLRHSPRDSATRFVIGTLYSAVGDVERAKAAYTKVLNVEPDNADAHFALAVLLRDNEHDPIAADPHFREYLRLKPSGGHVEEAQASLVKPVVPVTMGVAPVTMGQPEVHLPTQIDPPPDNEPKD